MTKKNEVPIRSVVYVRTLGVNIESEMKNFLENIRKKFHVRKRDKVCIKPNLCLMKSPNTGVTTDIRLISAVVDFIKEEWIDDISIVESNANINNIDVTYKALGFEQIASSKGVNLINLSREKTIEVKIDGYYLKKIKVPRILHECDYLISMAKLKTHSFTTISCVLKNQFGCIPGNKVRYHKVISEVIADVNTVFKPNFCFMDGLIALNGSGPIYGQPVPLNLILAGADPVAVDSASARAMGFNPMKIRHIMLSENAGIGSTQYTLNGNLPNMKFNCNTILDKMTSIFLSHTRGRTL
jgi:uncharacterized protein (DUF362 family)